MEDSPSRDDRSRSDAGQEGIEAPTEDLIRAAKEGDREAWRRLDRRMRLALNLMMRGRVPPALRRRFDTEDIVQSVFLSAFKELDSYEHRGRGSFLGWMQRIFENRLRDRIRANTAKKRSAKREQPISQIQGELDGQTKEQDPFDVVAAAESSARLLEQIARLEDDSIEAVTMYLFDRKSLGQISTELGVPETTVSRRVYKALDRLARAR